MWAGAALWIAVAALCWAVMGAAAGLLAGLLRPAHVDEKGPAV
jgi:hypothetical protein